MAERKQYDPVLVAVGNMLAEKRKALGLPYKNRENFIERRKEELFAGRDWISPRHLANVELGKNWISIEKLIWLADALEVNPVELFEEIYKIYVNQTYTLECNRKCGVGLKPYPDLKGNMGNTQS